MENVDLVQAAFQAWSSLIYVMGSQPKSEIIQHTFAIVAQKWQHLGKEGQNKAQELIEHIVELHGPEMPDYAAMIPSLGENELFAKTNKSVEAVKKKISVENMLQAYALRCKDDSVIVVRQALQELIPYLNQHQIEIHESGNEQELMPAVSALYRSLLDTSMRYKEHDLDVIDSCAQNLGILGCMDPNRLESLRKNQQMLVLSNFANPAEVIDFIAYMVENVLVQAFKSAPTGKQQSYLAYVMQELLKICGMTEAVGHRARGSPAKKAALIRWQQFPQSIQSILTPYLSSKYLLSNPDPPSDLQPFPESGQPPDHASWLRNFVFHFLHRARGRITKEIFPVISRVILRHDLSISSFMIPFIVQNIVVDGSDIEIEFIKCEMQAIIEFEIENLDAVSFGNIKQCSEVS
jgi:serine/threonine-protein kinase ATR